MVMLIRRIPMKCCLKYSLSDNFHPLQTLVDSIRHDTALSQIGRKYMQEFMSILLSIQCHFHTKINIVNDTEIYVYEITGIILYINEINWKRILLNEERVSQRPRTKIDHFPLPSFCQLIKSDGKVVFLRGSMAPPYALTKVPRTVCS